MIPNDSDYSWSPVTPHNGYREAYYDAGTGITIQRRHATDHTGDSVIMTGRALQKVRDNTELQLTRLLGHVLNTAKTVSRMDVTVDDTTGAFSVMDLFNCAERGGIHTRAGYRLITGGKNKTGDTLYIGSRASPRMTRYYDKAAEQGIPDAKWVRCETEFKKEEAMNAIRTILSAPPGFTYRTVLSLVSCLATFENDGWFSLFRTTETLPAVARPKDSDTLKWVYDAVIPALARLVLDEGIEDITEEVAREVAELVARKRRDKLVATHSLQHHSNEPGSGIVE